MKIRRSRGVQHVVRYGLGPSPDDAFEAICGAGRPYTFPSGDTYVMADDPLDKVTCPECLRALALTVDALLDDRP